MLTAHIFWEKRLGQWAAFACRNVAIAGASSMRGRRLHHSSKLIIVSMSAVCLSSVRLRRVTISLSFQPSDAQWPFIEYNFAYNFVYDGARSQEDEMGKKGKNPFYLIIIIIAGVRRSLSCNMSHGNWHVWRLTVCDGRRHLLWFYNIEINLIRTANATLMDLLYRLRRWLTVNCIGYDFDGN